MKKLFAYMDVFFRKFQLPKGCEYVGQNAYFGAFQPRRGCMYNRMLALKISQPRIGCV